MTEQEVFDMDKRTWRDAPLVLLIILIVAIPILAMCDAIDMRDPRTLDETGPVAHADYAPDPAVGLPTTVPTTSIAPVDPVISTQAHRGPQIQVTEPPPAPPPEPPPGFTNCQQMFWWRAFVGLPQNFDAIGQRESGVGQCLNTAISPTGCCVGWWQLHEIIFRDHRMIDRLAWCGATWLNVRGADVASKRRQACAAKVLFDVAQYTPWKATT